MYFFVGQLKSKRAYEPLERRSMSRMDICNTKETDYALLMMTAYFVSDASDCDAVTHYFSNHAAMHMIMSIIIPISIMNYCLIKNHIITFY